MKLLVILDIETKLLSIWYKIIFTGNLLNITKFPESSFGNTALFVLLDIVKKFKVH